jgi:hypothetical protein
MDAKIRTRPESLVSYWQAYCIETSWKPLNLSTLVKVKCENIDTQARTILRGGYCSYLDKS